MKILVAGRYGDSLNPWGDLMTVAEAWCVAAPGAKLALGVPTYTGQHGAMWANVHRIYGSKNLPFLVS